MSSDADPSGTGEKRRKGFLSYLNKQATLRGAINSTMTNTMRGASVIKSASGQLRAGTAVLMRPGRIETFEEALERNGVLEEDLPLIHNQLLLQMYAAGVFAVVAYTVAGVHTLQQSYFSGLLSLILGTTCAAHFSQSSLRAFQVRRRRLGAAAEWLTSPSEWLPSRMKGVRSMQKLDPLRRPALIEALARKSRLSLTLAGLVGGIGLAAALGGAAAIPLAWITTCVVSALVLLAIAVRYSFETFRRRAGMDCDLLLWIASPKHWVPSGVEPRLREGDSSGS